MEVGCITKKTLKLKVKRCFDLRALSFSGFKPTKVEVLRSKHYFMVISELKDWLCNGSQFFARVSKPENQK